MSINFILNLKQIIYQKLGMAFLIIINNFLCDMVFFLYYHIPSPFRQILRILNYRRKYG
jgi:hypothetical protein